MRHGDKINNLGRTASHRRALLANLANALITHKRINTTVAKAKALRRYVEPLLTKSKDNTTHSRRIIFGYLQNKDVMKELFGVVAPKIADRPGGYLRIIKTGFRRGDGADMAMIELVDFNELYNPKGNKETAAKKKTRRGSSKKSTTVTTVSGDAISNIVTTSSTTTTTTTSKIVDIDYDDDNTTTVINPTV
jgi:large subunit ribosomal protein L17